MIYVIAASVCFMLLIFIIMREIRKQGRAIRSQWDAIKNLHKDICSQRVLLNAVKTLAEHTAQEKVAMRRKENNE